MNYQKGMSQTLALIVAASVLMMTALTVIFLAQGSLGDFGTDTEKSGCTNTVRALCDATDGMISVPSSCKTDAGQMVADVTGGNVLDAPAKGEEADGEIDCGPTEG